jgi:NTP pyrophosphatase (non-canonical NTP hydrolase)
MTPSAKLLHDLIVAADARYGAFASTHEAMGVAMEEWDELRDAIKANDLGAVAKESLDLAAVCIRLHDQLSYSQQLRERSVK